MITEGVLRSLGALLVFDEDICRGGARRRKGKEEASAEKVRRGYSEERV